MRKCIFLVLLTYNATAMESPQAPAHQKWDGKYFHKHTKQSFSLAHQILADYPLEQHHRILDLGCGSGDITAHIAKRVPDATVVGVDPSGSMIRFARGYYENQKNLFFEDGDAWSVKNDYDLIFSCNAFHLIPKDEHPKVLQHLATNVAKKKTQLLMIMAARTKTPQPFERAYAATMQMPQWKDLQGINLDDYFQPHNEDTFAILLKDSGFTLTKMKTVDEYILFKNHKKLQKFITSWMGGFGFVAALAKKKQKQLIEDLMVNYSKEVPLSSDGLIEWRSPRFVVHAQKE